MLNPATATSLGRRAVTRKALFKPGVVLRLVLMVTAFAYVTGPTLAQWISFDTVRTEVAALREAAPPTTPDIVSETDRTAESSLAPGLSALGTISGDAGDSGSSLVAAAIRALQVVALGLVALVIGFRSTLRYRPRHGAGWLALLLGSKGYPAVVGVLSLERLRTSWWDLDSSSRVEESTFSRASQTNGTCSRSCSETLDSVETTGGLVDRVYENDSIRVMWDSSLCIHTGRCLGAAGDVFDVQRRPWVNLDGGTLDETITAIEGCPSGALRCERLDGGPQEVVVSTVTVVPWPNGPLMVRGNVEVRDARGELFDVGPRLTLCRCGHSKNHPFCDLSHREAGFKNFPRVESEVRAAAQAPDEIADEPLS